MARAPKKDKNGKNTGQTETVATTLLMPAPKVMQDIAKAKRSAKKRTGVINGEVGDMIAKAVENKHLDRKACSIACQLDAMDDERLGVTYFHMLRYFDDLDIPKRAKAQNEMFEAKDTGPGLKSNGKDDDGEGEETAGNVTRIGTAARKVAERAGEQA